MDIKGYSAHVLVNGRKVKEYRHNGLTFIEAKDGTEFAIEVKNHSNGRVLAVVSVDGLDIIEGKAATKNSGGYLVGSGSAETFSGWRKSDTEVGAFKFTAKGNSYATEKGKGENNGIIAIKLFGEKAAPITYAKRKPINFPWPQTLPKRPFPYLGDVASGSSTHGVGGYVGSTTYGATRGGGRGMSAGSTLRSADVSKSASVNFMHVAEDTSFSVSDSMDAAPNFDMGTTWGEKKEEVVVSTTFNRGVELGTFEFYYASREALQAMGIPLITYREVVLPQGFPSTNAFAQPPANWKK